MKRNKMLSSGKKFAKGFTIAQMLASVAVGAVLTSAGATFYWDAVDRAKLVGEKETLNNINDALMLSLNAIGNKAVVDIELAQEMNERISGLGDDYGYSLSSAEMTSGTALMALVYARSAEEAANIKRVAPELEKMVDGKSGTKDSGRFRYNDSCDSGDYAAASGSTCYFAYYLMGSGTSPIDDVGNNDWIDFVTNDAEWSSFDVTDTADVIGASVFNVARLN